MRGDNEEAAGRGVTRLLRVVFRFVLLGLRTNDLRGAMFGMVRIPGSEALIGLQLKVTAKRVGSIHPNGLSDKRRTGHLSGRFFFVFKGSAHNASFLCNVGRRDISWVFLRVVNFVFQRSIGLEGERATSTRVNHRVGGDLVLVSANSVGSSRYLRPHRPRVATVKTKEEWFYCVLNKGSHVYRVGFL